MFNSALVASILIIVALLPVEFRHANGDAIFGDVYGSGTRGVVIVAHGGYSTRPSWQTEAQAIADAGFQVLVFETRAAAEFATSGKENACCLPVRSVASSSSPLRQSLRLKK